MIGTLLSNIGKSIAPRRALRVLKGPAVVLFIIGLLSNVISVFTALFTLLVYDKVYPHDGLNTLIVLTIGVAGLIVIDVSLKLLRSKIINQSLYGELAVGSAPAMRSTFEQRSAQLSLGTRAQTYLEQSMKRMSDIRPSDVRSAVLIVDLPFIVVLLLAIYVIAGPMVWIPIVALIVLVIYVGISYRAFHENSKELESIKQKSIENLAFLARGNDWLFGFNGWQWLVGREVASRNQISSQTAKVSSLSNQRQVVYQTVIQVVSITTVVFGFFLFREGELGFGGVIATYLLANRALSPVGNIVQVATVNEVAEVENGETSDVRDEVPVGLDNESWTVEFKNVSFTYTGKSEASTEIKALSLQKGERLGVVGKAGSGKSTFVKLLTRMLSGYQGSISWNGIPLDSLNYEQWTKLCLYVPQTPWLGKGSLFDQIRLGDDSITDLDIANAFRRIGMSELLVSGTNTISGDGFSAGQLQAIGLVRCLVRKAELLVLDEPTNYLDEETENRVMSAIFEQYADAAIILITHKNTLLKDMQRALVFEEGRLVRDAKIAVEVVK